MIGFDVKIGPLRSNLSCAGDEDSACEAKKVTKEVFDSFQNRFKNFSQEAGKFLIPIKYRNCYFFSVS